MSFINFSSDELKQDKAVKSTTMHKIRSNLEWLKYAYQYNISQLPNRDFEYVTDGKPDMWTCTTFEGGFVGVSTSNLVSGMYSLAIVHDGGTRSGGMAVSDYVPVTSASTRYRLTGHRRGSGIPAKILVNFLNSSFGSLGSSVIYDTTSIPMGAANVNASFTTPANCRWITIQCMSATSAAATQSGTIIFDNFQLVSEAMVSG